MRAGNLVSSMKKGRPIDDGKRMVSVKAPFTYATSSSGGVMQWKKLAILEGVK
jgi:hypothetical protein